MSKFALFALFTAFACTPSSTNNASESTLLPDPLAAGWEGASVCEVVVDNERVRTLRCTFPPGVGHERHYHPAHVGHTVRGSRFRITDSTGTREVDVPTGYTFYNDTITWHEVLNVGKDTGVFLIIEPK